MEREKERDEGKNDWREPQQKQQRGARDGYLANLVTEKGEVRDASNCDGGERDKRSSCLFTPRFFFKRTGERLEYLPYYNSMRREKFGFLII